MTKVVKFKIEKATKNTIKFAEVEEPGKPPVIGALYVQKWVVGAAQNLEVTLTIPDAVLA
jgi:hypothetical protein